MDRVFPQRRAPAKGVHISIGGLNWVFLTVCTEKREPWFAQPSVQRALHDVWKNTATAWLVSDYLLMPDHLHMFCAPHDLKFTIERWIGFWKDGFAKGWKGRDALLHVQSGSGAPLPYHETHIPIGKFQRGGFHHRLRDEESYHEKWLYVQENPVRAGLVLIPEDWPYQGRVHEIHW
jgi:putative transposase